MRTRSLFSLTLIALSSLMLCSCSDKGLFGGSDGGGSKSFQGRITYQVDYQLPPKRQRMASMLPNKELVYIKDGKSRLERKLTMGIVMSVIHDPEKDSLVQLIDPKGMGQAGPTRVVRAIDTSENRIEYTEKRDTLTVKTGKEGEQKEYVCKKAIVKRDVKGKELKMPVWYTEKLQGEPFRQFKGLKGLPLKFKSEANGYKVEKEVKKIVEEPLADSIFNDHPEGYKTRSMKEFQQMMGGGAP